MLFVVGLSRQAVTAFVTVPRRSLSVRGLATSVGSRSCESLSSSSGSSPLSFRKRNTVSTIHCWRLFSTESDESSGSDTEANPSESKKRVVFLGTPDVAAETLKTLYEDSQREDSTYELVGVVTQPPKRRKRKGKVVPSPVGVVAEELDIPVLSPEKAKDPEFLQHLEETVRPDLCITAAYGQYLPKRFLATPTFGTVNIHPSLLPRWRGASPVQRSLQYGDNPCGVSVLFTVSKMDAGPIIAQEEKEIGENDQATTVLPLLFEIGTQSLIQAMPDLLNGKITMDTATPQDESKVTEAGMIDAAEAELRAWEETALECHNRIRGFSMWPNPFMFFRIGDEDEEPVKVKILNTRVLDEKVEPTNVIQIGPKKGDGLRIVCADGSVLEVLQLQPVTKKVMDAKSFVNGLQGRQVVWVQPPQPEEEEETATVATGEDSASAGVKA